MTRRWAWIRLVLAVATLTACNDSSDGSELPPQPTQKLDFSRFDAAWEKAVADYNAQAAPDKQIAGASAVIVHEKLGAVHTRGYGAFAADRLYLIASASKILSVGVLLRLADQGKLDIDAPLERYVADWGQTKASKLTVAQLLSNSSGLPSLNEVSAAATDPQSPFFSNVCQYNDGTQLQDCAKILYATEPPRPADTMFAYGGSQWQLAGAIAERVSGQSWAELIDDTYVEPCDVPSLGYTNQYTRSGRTYPDYFMANEANVPVTQNPSIEGGAYVTAPDYGKLLLMHLRGGRCGEARVLSEAAVTRMRTDRLKQYGGSTGQALTPGYGLGFWIDATGQVVTDPGAYGAYPLLDLQRRYGVFIAIELTAEVGVRLGSSVKPVLDQIFDEAKL